MATSMICRVHCSVLAWLLLASVVPAGEPSPHWKIETSDRQKIEARIKYEIHTTNYLVTRWLVFMPDPPGIGLADRSQSNLHAKVSGG